MQSFSNFKYAFVYFNRLQWKCSIACLLMLAHLFTATLGTYHSTGIICLSRNNSLVRSILCKRWFTFSKLQCDEIIMHLIFFLFWNEELRDFCFSLTATVWFAVEMRAIMVAERLAWNEKEHRQLLLLSLSFARFIYGSYTEANLPMVCVCVTLLSNDVQFACFVFCLMFFAFCFSSLNFPHHLRYFCNMFIWIFMFILYVNFTN